MDEVVEKEDFSAMKVIEGRAIPECPLVRGLVKTSTDLQIKGSILSLPFVGDTYFKTAFQTRLESPNNVPLTNAPTLENTNKF